MTSHTHIAMTMPHPALLFLYRTVYLDNARPHLQEMSSFVFDAVFSCSHPMPRYPQGIGCFQQAFENMNINTMPHGFYSLSAKVCVHYPSFFTS